jgi:hypothetical protein
MNTAIYSCGPHLERTATFDYPLKIAVNEAINRIPVAVEWYCAGDWEAYVPSFTRRRPTIGWCSMSNIYEKRILRELPGWEPLRHLTWAELPALQGAPFNTFSSGAAIALALLLGATSITLFGDDRIDEPKRYDWNRRNIETPVFDFLQRTNPTIPMNRVLLP